MKQQKGGSVWMTTSMELSVNPAIGANIDVYL